MTGREVHKIINVPDYDGCKSECLGDYQCTMGTYQERSGFNLCFMYTRETGALTFPSVGQSFIKRCEGMFLKTCKFADTVYVPPPKGDILFLEQILLVLVLA